MTTLLTYVALFTFLTVEPRDFASSALEVSHQSEVKKENQALSVICRDKDTGAKALWRGPRNKKLNAKTNPQARTTSYGLQLIFSKIRKEDAGTYTCYTNREIAEFNLFVEDETETSIDNPEPEIFIETYTKPTKKYTPITEVPKRYKFLHNTITTTIIPTSPGPILFVDTPMEQDGKEGTDILVKCEARGAFISWLIDDETPQAPKYKIMGDGLLVVNATKEDARTYTCKALGEITGDIEDRLINLTVTHPPRLPLNTTEKHYMREEIVYGYIGGIVNLTCEVESEPPPKFTWFGKSQRKKIGEEITGENPYQSVLMLKMTWKNIGEYKCSAENSFGKLDVLFKLLNGSQPNPPSYLKLLEVTTDSLTMEIDGPEPTEEEITSNMVPMGYRVEYRPFDLNESWISESFPFSEAKTYSLMQLEHRTQYEVRAATENPAGISDFTNTSIFQTNFANSLNNSKITLVASFPFSILIIILNGVFDNHI